jgi:GntR family transcriptional regulator
VTAPSGKRLRYQEIADDIRDHIRDGRLAPGARIGTFESLGVDYDAAKGTIDKALDVLRQEGIVATVAGKGIFVLKSPGEPEPSPEFVRLASAMEDALRRLDKVEERLDELERAPGNGPQ